MRILHLISSFSMGGAENVAAQLAASQKEAGHDVMVGGIGPLEGAMVERLHHLGLEAIPLHKRPSGYDTRLVVKMWRLMREREVDLVHSHAPLTISYAGPAARFARCTTIHTKHETGAQPTARRQFLMRLMTPLCHAFIGVSEAAAESAKRLREGIGVPVEVVLNGLDLRPLGPDPKARKDIRQLLGVSEKVFLFGTVARFEAVKNQQLMLRSVAPLLNENCHMVLVGNGSLEQNLKELAQESGKGAFIHFPGLQQNVPHWLSAMDAFVLSSHREGLPMSVLEAMACELPVVSTAVGGLNELICSDETGFLTEPGNATSMTKCLQRLVSNPKLVQRVGRAGAEMVRRDYSVDKMRDAYFEVYRKYGRK
jgi:glycosyltransferase involved in cell wall biosynthesis